MTINVGIISPGYAGNTYIQQTAIKHNMNINILDINENNIATSYIDNYKYDILAFNMVDSHYHSVKIKQLKKKYNDRKLMFINMNGGKQFLQQLIAIYDDKLMSKL